jgi:Rab-GTPase-TBC domain
MEGSPQTPPCASPQSWLDMRPMQRSPAATSLSFPSKPPGVRQFSHPTHAAIQAFHDLHNLPGDILNPHHHQSVLVVPSPVHTVDEGDQIAIHGSHSFTLHSEDQTHQHRTSLGRQLSDAIQFPDISDGLAKRDPYHNRIYSVPIAFNQPYQRSLTSNHNISNYEMTTTATAPNSPPDLSGSKSSKSSSFQSSQFDSPDGIVNDVSNFEEIGLDENSQDPPGEPATWDQHGFAKRSTSRVSLIGARAAMPARDLTSGKKRPTYPSLQGQVQDALSNKNHNTANLPRSVGGAAGGLKRGFTAPPAATLPMPIPGCQPRTRSSSPSPKQPASASFITTGHNVRLGPQSRSAGPTSRRGSWQPSRKTIKELEAEYHDSDDELPDDTSLWNVPMSPRPPTARPSSTRSSNRGSPERDAIGDLPPPIPLSHAVSVPDSPTRHAVPQSIPRNRPPPRTSSLQATTSTATSPTSPNYHASFQDTRATSWTIAMADLSEEAQVLTETLEFHADTKGRMHEQNVQNGGVSSRPSLEANARRSARSSAIELPPIQKGNILIDPMPLSKEKAAVLTRTRPSWLPPKDPKEEKRHLKEYQRMMAASLVAEKRKEDKTRARQCEKDNTREALNRVWEQYVCPEWDRVTHEHRTRELWWRGVSPKIRGQVWMRAIGNSLGLTHRSYERALQRVKDLQSRPMADLSEKERIMRAWFSDIERDARSAFPELNLFQKAGPMWQELVDVCCAYVSYRSDVGYLYGIQVSCSGVNSQAKSTNNLK